MVASHKYRPNRIKKHEDLHEGRERGKASKAIVSPDDYPKLSCCAQLRGHRHD